MFFDRFEELCVQKGIKPGRACAEMGVSRSLAAKWKATGTEKPSADVLEKMSIYFGMSIDEILGRGRPTMMDVFSGKAGMSEVFPDSSLSETKKPATPEGDGLTADERALLDLFRALTPERQEKLSTMVRAFVEAL